MCSTAAFIGGFDGLATALCHRSPMTITKAPLRRDTHSRGPFATRVSPDLCEGASRWHVTFDPSFSTVIPDLNLHSITLVGFVGSDPEQRQARNNGSKFTVLTVATQRSRKNAEDEWVSKVEWHRIAIIRN